jgi:hypothetical protein
MEKKYISLIGITIFVILLSPYLLALGPNNLRDFMYRELVFQVISDKVVTAADSEQEKVMKLQDWVYGSLYPIASMGMYDDNALADLVRGIGFCDNSANSLINLAKKSGIRGRVIALNGDVKYSRHSIAELEVDGAFRVFDPLYNIILLNKKGLVATHKDLGTNNFKSTVHRGERRKVRTIHSDTPGDFYLNLYKPAFPPRTLARNYTYSGFKKLLAKVQTIYYSVLGDFYLKSFEFVYFLAEKPSRLVNARYKHLTFRYKEAIDEYDKFIIDIDKNNFGMYSKADSAMWDTRKQQIEGYAAFRFFRAKAYLDLENFSRCESEFDYINQTYPGSRWAGISKIHLITCQRMQNTAPFLSKDWLIQDGMLKIPKT